MLMRRSGLGWSKRNSAPFQVRLSNGGLITVDTVNESSRSEIHFPSEDRIRCANVSCILVAHRKSPVLLRLRATTPAQLNPRGLSPCARNSSRAVAIRRSGFFIRQIIKLAFVLRIDSGHEFISQSFFCLRRTFVEVAVNYDFVSLCFQTPVASLQTSLCLANRPS